MHQNVNATTSSRVARGSTKCPTFYRVKAFNLNGTQIQGFLKEVLTVSTSQSVLCESADRHASTKKRHILAIKSCQNLPSHELSWRRLYQNLLVNSCTTLAASPKSALVFPSLVSSQDKPDRRLTDKPSCSLVPAPVPPVVTTFTSGPSKRIHRLKTSTSTTPTVY